MVSLGKNKTSGKSAKIRNLTPAVDLCEKRTAMEWVRDRKADLPFLKKETKYYSALIRVSGILEKKQAKEILLQFQDLVHEELPKIIVVINQLEEKLTMMENCQNEFNKQNFDTVQNVWSDFKGKYVAAKLKVLDAIIHYHRVVII